MAAFLLGFLPFVNIFRAFPIPSLWMDLAAVIAFGLWLMIGRPGERFAGRAFNGPSGLGWLPAAVGVIAIAIALDGTRSAGGVFALLSVMVMGLAVCVHLKAGIFEPGFAAARENLFLNWTVGLLAAFAANVVATGLSWSGYEVVLWRVVEAQSLPRAGGTFGQPNQFAVFCVLCLGAVHYLSVTQTRWKWWLIPVQALAVIMLAMTASRAGLIAWAMCLGFWLVWAGRYGHPRRQLLFELPLMLVAQFAWFVWTSGTSDSDGSIVQRASVGHRIEQWRDAWELMQMHPWAGVGWGNLAYSRYFMLDGSLSEPQASHTHNVFTQLAVELGVAGWLASCLLIGLVVSALRRALLGDAGDAAAGAAVLALSLYSMFEYPLWCVNFLLTFSFAAGVVMARGSVYRKEILRPIIFRAVGCLAVVLAAFFSWDYFRLQRDLFQVGAQLFGGQVTLVSEETIAAYRISSLYSGVVDEYWISTSDYQDGLAPLKFPIVERLFAAAPSGGGAAQYICYALAAGEEEKARRVYMRLFRSSEHQYARMRHMLVKQAADDAVLLRFLQSVPGGLPP